MSVRDKVQKINYMSGFTDEVTKHMYYLTSIYGNKLKGVVVDNHGDIKIESFELNMCHSKLNWVIQDKDCVSGLSNISNVFGEAVMPSNRSRIRKSVLLSKKYRPLSAENRKINAVVKKTAANEVYTRYKLS